MSKNTNCLEGVRCPKCGWEDGFRIGVVFNTVVYMTDDGYDVSDMELGDNEWVGPISCVECEHEGTLNEFRVKEDSNA